MMYIAGLCSLLSLISMQGFKAVNCNRCYDTAVEQDVKYARMCSDDRVTSHQIVLDTFEAETTGETTCLCQVYKEGAANNLQFLNIRGFGNGSTPNVSECGSTVRLRSNNNEHMINCSTFPSILTYIAPMDVIWTALYAGDSKYCLEIKTTVPSDATITVSCKTAGITTPASASQCITLPGSTRELDDVISTTPTDVQGLCVSVQSVVLTIVFGYLLAAAVTVSTVMYFRRKTIQVERQLKKNVDERHGTVSTVSTDLTIEARRMGAPTPEPRTTTIHLYDDPDSNRYDDLNPKRYDDRDSKKYDDLVPQGYDDLESKKHDDPDSKIHDNIDPDIFDEPDSERRDNIDPDRYDDPAYLHVVS